MATRILGTLTGRSDSELPRFEIRLDEEVIFFHGSRRETRDEIKAVSGTIVLMILKPQKIRNAYIVFECHRKTSHFLNRRAGELAHTSGNPIKNKDLIFQETVKICDKNGERLKNVTLPAGNHEFPFKFALKGDTYESVEGMKESYRVYDLRAIFQRTPMGDFHVTKRVHILRTLASHDDFGIPLVSVHSGIPNTVDTLLTMTGKRKDLGKQSKVLC